ncbi:MAG: NHL domain-containing thioredoxin family protein [Promicromonosporaceae bacterium]|nr:NHL domain-containing thioredoxin family protein [Promicromonosporaceae bacterium]
MGINATRLRAPELQGRGWLNTGGREITLADLRGKIVVLDFWTFCCINCLHVLDELRPLEAEFAEVLVTIGVHSPKFAHEADPAALAAAVERYEVQHPVLDDPELLTWRAYGARAWPTLVVIDPEGHLVATMAGEGHGSALAALLARLVSEHEAKGTLHRGDGPYVAPEPTSGTLRFPSKVIALPPSGGQPSDSQPSGSLLVADAGHHSLAELAPDGQTLVRRIGTGERGLVDGSAAPAFSEPSGLCLVPSGLRERLGYDVVVADTVNHALRGVRLSDGLVTTVAGTGQQFQVGGLQNYEGHTADFEPGTAYPATELRLSSPWDVAWSEVAGGFIVAMAGNHTMWLFDPLAQTVRLFAGTFNEGLLDGPGQRAWFAQPSGITPATAAPEATERPGQESFWVADSETSAIRHLLVGRDAAGRPAVLATETTVGLGLFDFGHVDGDRQAARLQHPLGLVALPDGSVVVADTYNGALRRIEGWQENEGGWQVSVSTLATGLAEPSDVLLEANEAGALTLLVVESAAHRLTRIALPPGLAGHCVDQGARRTQRPATEVAPGALRLEVPFTPAPGQKIDDRFGPATSLQVSATPPALLLAGAGDGVDLSRDLLINPEVAAGVLHVTAKAASCDDDPDNPYPACHLAQQDWGVPVRVSAPVNAPAQAAPGDDPAPPLLSLPLRG